MDHTLLPFMTHATCPSSKEAMATTHCRQHTDIYIYVERDRDCMAKLKSQEREEKKEKQEIRHSQCILGTHNL
jgi:hypothetical protein